MTHFMPPTVHVPTGIGICPCASIGDTYSKQEVDPHYCLKIPDGHLTIIGYAHSVYIGGRCSKHKMLSLLVLQGTHNPQGLHYYLHPFQLPRVACAFCKASPILDNDSSTTYKPKHIIEPHYPIISEDDLRTILDIHLKYNSIKSEAAPLTRYDLLDLE